MLKIIKGLQTKEICIPGLSMVNILCLSKIKIIIKILNSKTWISFPWKIPSHRQIRYVIKAEWLVMTIRDTINFWVRKWNRWSKKVSYICVDRLIVILTLPFNVTLFAKHAILKLIVAYNIISVHHIRRDWKKSEQNFIDFDRWHLIWWNMSPNTLNMFPAFE